MTTKIEWADETINPITGCTPISEGCANCYAARMAKRLAGRYGYPADDPFRPGVFHPGELEKLAKWKKPRRVFVGSMGDMFHGGSNIHGPEIRSVFRAMVASDHTCMVLTKRPYRMAMCVRAIYGEDLPGLAPNVLVGTTIENQYEMRRVEGLANTPAAIRFVSVEPMLGYVDFIGHLFSKHGVGWVIIGAETGPKRRQCKLEWVVDLVRQCVAAGVPVFVKKVEINGRITGNMEDWPVEIRRREFPKA